MLTLSTKNSWSCCLCCRCAWCVILLVMFAYSSNDEIPCVQARPWTNIVQWFATHSSRSLSLTYQYAYTFDKIAGYAAYAFFIADLCLLIQLYNTMKYYVCRQGLEQPLYCDSRSTHQDFVEDVLQPTRSRTRSLLQSSEKHPCKLWWSSKLITASFCWKPRPFLRGSESGRRRRCSIDWAAPLVNDNAAAVAAAAASNSAPAAAPTAALALPLASAAAQAPAAAVVATVPFGETAAQA